MYYILTNKNKIKRTRNIIEYSKWRESTNKWIISLTVLPNGNYISTVFLGIDHAFNYETQPILFESMVFGGHYDEYQIRYRTYIGAIIGHKKIVSMVRNKTKSINLLKRLHRNEIDLR